MYNKICLIGPRQYPVIIERITEALEFITANDEVNCILVGSLLTPLGIAAAEFANENGIMLECIEAKYEELGNDAPTRQLWDMIGAGTDLFVIFPPFDVSTHNAQVLATYSGVAQWVPYDG